MPPDQLDTSAFVARNTFLPSPESLGKALDSWELYENDRE